MQANITAEERNWAAIAHASVLVSGLLGIMSAGIGTLLVAVLPLAIYVGFRERSRFVAFQALQATALQLGGLIVYAIGLAVLIFFTVIAWVVAGILTVVLIGVLLYPLALAVTMILVIYAVLFPLLIMAYGLYGAVEAGKGLDFRYVWIADWLGDSSLLS